MPYDVPHTIQHPYEQQNQIIITRKNSIPITKGSPKTFTGDVDIEFAIPQRANSHISGGLVTFHPKARTHWHTHPYGQLLIITAGKGYVQQWGKPIQSVSQGDIVWFPANVKHWHGATPDQSMSHYAIQEDKNGNVVQWMEPVTDKQYNNEK